MIPDIKEYMDKKNISISYIDDGKTFDWGKTSEDYVKYRDIYPDEFYQYIRKLGLCKDGQRVLDIGTGTGVLPRNMYGYGAKWTGTDIAENQIEQAKKLAAESNMDIDFFVCRAEDVDFPDETFDVITACQCIWYPDHKITAPKFARILKPGGKYGAAVYASEGERTWIEDIDLQFAERPIPNFYTLAGRSVNVDYIVKDGDVIVLSDEISVHVIGTPGHSADEVSYRMDDVIFIGDAVPVKGDIPIFMNLEKTKNSLLRLKKLTNIKLSYPAWDQTYSAEMLKRKIDDARELVAKLEEAAGNVDNSMEDLELVDLVCESLNMPMLKTNPLFARTVACCRKDRNIP